MQFGLLPYIAASENCRSGSQVGYAEHLAAQLSKVTRLSWGTFMEDSKQTTPEVDGEGLLPAVYDELRKLAQRRIAAEAQAGAEGARAGEAKER